MQSQPHGAQAALGQGPRAPVRAGSPPATAVAPPTTQLERTSTSSARAGASGLQTLLSVPSLSAILDVQVLQASMLQAEGSLARRSTEDEDGWLAAFASGELGTQAALPGFEDGAQLPFLLQPTTSLIGTLSLPPPFHASTADTTASPAARPVLQLPGPLTSNTGTLQDTGLGSPSSVPPSPWLLPFSPRAFGMPSLPIPTTTASHPGGSMASAFGAPELHPPGSSFTSQPFAIPGAGFAHVLLGTSPVRVSPHNSTRIPRVSEDPLSPSQVAAQAAQAAHQHHATIPTSSIPVPPPQHRLHPQDPNEPAGPEQGSSLMRMSGSGLPTSDSIPMASSPITAAWYEWQAMERANSLMLHHSQQAPVAAALEQIAEVPQEAGAGVMAVDVAMSQGPASAQGPSSFISQAGRLLSMASPEHGTSSSYCPNCTMPLSRACTSLCTYCGHVAGPCDTSTPARMAASEAVVDQDVRDLVGMVPVSTISPTTTTPPTLPREVPAAGFATLLGYDDRMLQHSEPPSPFGREHPERPARIVAIMERLQQTGLLRRCMQVMVMAAGCCFSPLR